MSVIYFIFLSFALSAGQFAENDGILELTQSDFEIAKNQFENLFVEFYAPWCGHCKSIATEYVEAAKIMKDMGLQVKFAKVNADEHTQLRDSFQVTGYPTFKFFLASKNKIIDYSAGRHAGDFVNFVKKKVTSAVHKVDVLEDATSVVQHNKLTFLGFFQDPTSKAAEVLNDFAFDNDKLLILSTSEAHIAAHFQVSPDAVVVFKQYDEGRVQMQGDITYANLKNFHIQHQLPLVNEFLEENADQIFTTSVKNYVALFVNKSSDRFSHIHDNFKIVAQEFIGKVIFLYVDLEEEEHEKVLEFFGVAPAKCPVVRFINMTLDDPVKYNPSSPDLDPQTMRAFVEGVLKGEVKPFFKSEEVPSNWEQTVKVLVGSTFESFIANAPLNTIVNFYVPWCGHCQKLAVIWDQLGEHFKDTGKVIVAKVDASLNEVPTLKLEHFPSLKLFLSHSKEVIEFTGERSLEALVEFVTSEGKIIRVPEENIPVQVPKDEL